jgi:hypothetical protein
MMLATMAPLSSIVPAVRQLTSFYNAINFHLANAAEYPELSY